MIVEVGTWKSASAVFFAQLMKDRGIDGAVICVDTWLGGFHSMPIRENKPNIEPGWEIEKYYKNGYPTLYYQFLANVVRKGLADYVVPIANTSVIAARWLAHHRIGADVIYVDGSHDEDDVYRDLLEYWKLLNYNGVICGDDFKACWYGVIAAVNRFAREHDLVPQVNEPTWRFHRKPSAATSRWPWPSRDRKSTRDFRSLRLGNLPSLRLDVRTITLSISRQIVGQRSPQ